MRRRASTNYKRLECLVKKPIILLAVDGGATKTTVTIRSSDGICYFEKSGLPSNYQSYGENAVFNVMNSLLKVASSSIKNLEIDVAVFAMAGIDTEKDLQFMKRLIDSCLQQIPLLIKKVIIENDVQATLLGLIGEAPGGILISGTGSIAYASNGDGLITRVGGWGHLVSDDGSGYWIGKEIVKSIFRAEEGLSETPTLLKELVFEKLNYTHIEELFSWLYHPHFTTAQMASISTVLQPAIDLGDASAIEIANKASNELFLLIKGVLTKINYGNSAMPFYLNGGILQYTHSITKQLIVMANDSYPEITFILCSSPPIESILKRGLLSVK